MTTSVNIGRKGFINKSVKYNVPAIDKGVRTRLKDTGINYEIDRAKTGSVYFTIQHKGKFVYLRISNHSKIEDHSFGATELSNITIEDETMHINAIGMPLSEIVSNVEYFLGVKLVLNKPANGKTIYTKITRELKKNGVKCISSFGVFGYGYVIAAKCVDGVYSNLQYYIYENGIIEDTNNNQLSYEDALSNLLNYNK